jgi:hypothetical protein
MNAKTTTANLRNRRSDSRKMPFCKSPSGARLVRFVATAHDAFRWSLNFQHVGLRSRIEA